MEVAIIKIVLGIVGIIIFSVITYKIAKTPIKNRREDAISIELKGEKETELLTEKSCRTSTYCSATLPMSEVLKNKVSPQEDVNNEGYTELLESDTELLADETVLLDNAKETELLER